MGKTRTVVAAVVMALIAVAGCTHVQTKGDALDALSSRSESKRSDALDYLFRLDADERLSLGRELFVAEDALRGHAGVRLLTSVSLSAEDWTWLQKKALTSKLVSRYLVLASQKGHTASLGFIVANLANADALSLPLYVSTLRGLTGLSFGGVSETPSTLHRRWKRHLDRLENGFEQLSRKVAALYATEDESEQVSILRSINPSSLPLICADISEMATVGRLAVAREFALMGRESRDEAVLELLVELLEHDDYIVRFNAANSIEELTGMELRFDPSASPGVRRIQLEQLKNDFAQ
ncbi:MAG: hypothetical protein U5N86_05280 [Planctomycetota bacterium]|nr:hypothetical protein [Planctomycetota bacterium]